jgi:hypothetical protein
MDDGQEEMKAQVGSLAFWTDANQESLVTKIDTIQEKMDAKLNIRLEKTGAWRKETTACLEKTKANPEKTKEAGKKRKISSKKDGQIGSHEFGVKSRRNGGRNGATESH